MMRRLGLLCLIAATATGCAGLEQWSEFKGADRKELPAIKVSGTTYKVFELSRTDESRVADRKNPNDTFAVYAVVGPGKTIYCGQAVGDCAKAIRDFNKRPFRSEKDEVLDGM
ncbi:hypothetical protein [Hoeflea alexandrii]